MIAIVDGSRCQGHARCWGLCPEVFDVDDVGFAVPGTRDVPPEHEVAARNAEQACPERAIRLEEA